jgi:hypothetical protein
VTSLTGTVALGTLTSGVVTSSTVADGTSTGCRWIGHRRQRNGESPCIDRRRDDGQRLCGRRSRNRGLGCSGRRIAARAVRGFDARSRVLRRRTGSVQAPRGITGRAAVLAADGWSGVGLALLLHRPLDYWPPDEASSLRPR